MPKSLDEAHAMRDFLAGQAPPPSDDGLDSRWSPSLWLLEASLSRDFSPTLCPSCGVPGVRQRWSAAPANESGLLGGHIVVCPCCQDLLDVIAR